MTSATDGSSRPPALPPARMLSAAAVAAVFLGGGAGTGLRYALVEVLRVAPGTWPWPTFVANVFGSYLLGRLTRAARDSAAVRRLGPLLATGFAGALTTFSAFAAEAIDLAAETGADAALLYAGVSVVAGVAAALRGLRRS